MVRAAAAPGGLKGRATSLLTDWVAEREGNEIAELSPNYMGFYWLGTPESASKSTPVK